MAYLYSKSYYVILLSIFWFAACAPDTIDTNPKGADIEKVNSSTIDMGSLNYRDTVYIPIYSDIYSESKDVKFLLTATLSIRNTSLDDTVYIGNIYYYDSGGKMIRNYLENEMLVLKPMQSVEYVIERNDNAGGTGANFLVNWASNSAQANPMFQGVMISTHGQQGISFITEGISTSRTAPIPSDSLIRE